MTGFLDQRKVVVCVGAGGVGKTTVSAALAIAAAVSGRRTLVMTIDPARRLANALGLSDFGSVAYEIPAAALRPYGVELAAPLWAMMPDVRQTFDDIIKRYAANSAQQQAILNNAIYKQFSTYLAGALEYAAVEKLFAAYSSGQYDLIVLDTPPSQNVVDFLSAPDRVVTFLEQGTIQWLQKPYRLAGRLSSRLFDFGNAVVTRALRHLVGADTLSAITEFLLGFNGMFDGFRERASRVRALLQADELAFLLVGTAHSRDRSAMRRFYQRLTSAGLHTRGVIVNRTRPTPYPESARDEVTAQIQALLPAAEDATAVMQALAEEAALAAEDSQACSELSNELDGIPVLALPELRHDVHDLESLAKLHHYFLPQEK